jgi:uncharacterized protein YndB with AHSA1/START domain
MGTAIGILAVRRSIFIEAAPDRVWQEFASCERMRRWFGLGHRLERYEPAPGGWVEIATPDEPPLRFVGRVLVFEPGRELTFENEWVGAGWTGVPLLTFRLSPALDGTLVELYHHSLERVGPTAAADHRGFEAGWGMRQLEGLRQLVAA